jgi:CheY-like chemotaxis protein
MIEDNLNLTEVLCAIFGIMGHEAVCADCAGKGIAKAMEFKPDVIFCDIGLPDKSGFEVAKVIRADGELKKIFMIALTGYVGEYDIKEAMACGFDRYMVKPVDMAALERVLAEYVQR